MSIQQRAESAQGEVNLILNELLKSFINTTLNHFRVRDGTRVFAWWVKKHVLHMKLSAGADSAESQRGKYMTGTLNLC